MLHNIPPRPKKNKQTYSYKKRVAEKDSYIEEARSSISTIAAIVSASNGKRKSYDLCQVICVEISTLVAIVEFIWKQTLIEHIRESIEIILTGICTIFIIPGLRSVRQARGIGKNHLEIISVRSFNCSVLR